MKVQLKRDDRGFTIIEVLIVLAIAGLILAIVFFAVPQLQRNQRDNQRQSMTTRVKAEIETYASNNQGKNPFAATGNCASIASAQFNCRDWYDTYISSGKVNINDPGTGGPTTLTAVYVPNGADGTLAAAGDQPTWAVGNTFIEIGGKCSGSQLAYGGAVGTANSKKYALMTALDRSNTWFCVDNG